MPSDDVFDTAFSWAEAGRAVALATVVSTWGSSPRPPGSHLCVSDEGEMAGSVSGGCIEGAVVKEAIDLLSGEPAAPPRLLDFSVTSEQAWEVGLACGGSVRVMVRDLAAVDALYRLARAALATGETSALVTRLRDGSSHLADAARAGDLPPAVAEAARAALREDKCRLVADGDDEYFIEVVAPPRRMIVVGAVHIAQALVPMAAIAGFHVTVVDPRRAYASDARFPGVDVRTDWPDEALDELKPDRRTAVVTLTHDPKLDDPALDRALSSQAFYVGALGSSRTQAKRVERLKAAGFDDAAIARIHGPVGLDIDAVSPAEIAVSILAEVVAVMRGEPEPGAGA